MSFRKQTKSNKSKCKKLFVKIYPNFISLNIDVAESLHGFDSCDTYIDNNKKIIKVIGNNGGQYKITRHESATRICCVNLLAGENYEKDRIYNIEFAENGFIFNY